MSSGDSNSPLQEPPAWRRWLEPRYAWGRSIHNLGPKLLAVAVAVTLWFVATADRRANVEQGYDVPITVRDTTGGRGEGTRATSDLNPSTVRVTLSGRPERLRELRSGNIEAIVDVTGAPEGSFTRPVVVSAPTATQVSRKSPDTVQGFVDTQLTRTLPIVLSVVTPPEASLPRYTVMPAEVRITGPGRVIARVAKMVTSPESLGAASEREVPLIALDDKGKPIEGVISNPATVTVRRLDTGELPIKTLPVILAAPPAGLRVTARSLQPSTVRVVAAPDLLARLREISGTVNYRPGIYTAPVQLDLPAGAQALENITVSLSVESVAPGPLP
ncbi:CdaR family protein [Deinococcus arenicola]|uniref:CdaR family protein n=1 Tax=Deinococcus arenicola TaxID=2994950 RepID=A0ABU4DQB9_9DEIO|nr:CdaR family protein [Deinococcus sp. ZS9-10]MDV6374628.1 CdaR family protein [Deinococcus sp. ZS9-10]